MGIPVDSMYWRGWCASEAGTGIVISDGFNDPRQRGAEHSEDSRCSHCGQAPLAWVEGRRRMDAVPLCRLGGRLGSFGGRVAKGISSWGGSCTVVGAYLGALRMTKLWSRQHSAWHPMHVQRMLILASAAPAGSELEAKGPRWGCSQG